MSYTSSLTSQKTDLTTTALKLKQSQDDSKILTYHNIRHSKIISNFHQICSHAMKLMLLICEPCSDLGKWKIDLCQMHLTSWQISDPAKIDNLEETPCFRNYQCRREKWTRLVDITEENRTVYCFDFRWRRESMDQYSYFRHDS